MPGLEATVSGKPRRGLVKAEVLRTFDRGADVWPHGLALRLRYAEEDKVILVVSGEATTDYDAPVRLAARPRPRWGS